MSRKFNSASKDKSVCANWQPESLSDSFSNEFPNGLRVLVVDDNAVELRLIERMIQTLNYKVTTCRQAEVALEILRENKDVFDIVVTDIHMPGMSGIELLQLIRVEKDLPVVMMSADDKRELVFEGVILGACDYLIKPVTLESLKTIWQHVFRKKGFGFRGLAAAQPRSIENGNQVSSLSKFCRVDHRKIPEAYTEKPDHLKRERDDESEDERKAYHAAKAKRRMVWTNELHEKFLEAVNSLGDKAVPIRILECMQRMNIPGVTRENIASHLQKHRLNLRKRDGSSEQKNQHNLASSSSREGAFFVEMRNFERGTQFAVRSDLITSTGFHLQEGSSVSFHSIPPQSSYYSSAVSLPPRNFPCINTTEVGGSSNNNVSPLVNHTQTDELENWGQGNMEQHLPPLPDLGFDGGDASALLIGEPSAYINELFPVTESNDQIGHFITDWPSLL